MATTWRRAPISSVADMVMADMVCGRYRRNSSLRARMSDCVDDVRRRMRNNRLQLIGAKTEFIWCAPPRRCHHVPIDVQLGPDLVQPVQRGITTISATNHIGHDHIGHRRNRPQTTLATPILYRPQAIYTKKCSVIANGMV